MSNKIVERFLAMAIAISFVGMAFAGINVIANDYSELENEDALSTAMAPTMQSSLKEAPKMMDIENVKGLSLDIKDRGGDRMDEGWGG